MGSISSRISASFSFRFRKSESSHFEYLGSSAPSPVLIWLEEDEFLSVGADSVALHQGRRVIDPAVSRK